MDLNAENFPAAISQPGGALVDFWAPWCSPCRQLAPILDQVGINLQLPIHKVNVDQHPGLAQEWQIQGLPTVVVFNNGAEAGRVIGLYPRQQMQNTIEQLLGN
jgi:thioredoxin 1